MDSIGGGDSSDAVSARRRSLEEQRARELDRIEARYKKQVDETRVNRDKAIEKIYGSAQNDIDAGRDDAQFKVERAKQAADERARAFQQDAARMTEEAKRQFQAKAKTLEKAARDMDEQRQSLQKRHEGMLSKLEQDREERYNDLSGKYSRQALDIENSHKRRLLSAEDRHAAELRSEDQRFKDDKSKFLSESDRKIHSLQQEKQEQQGAIESELDSARQRGDAQLEGLRANQSMQRTLVDSEYNANIDDLNRRYNLEMTRTSMRGKRLLDDLKEKQFVEAAAMERESAKKIRDAQALESVRLLGVENDGKLREHIAKQAFSNQQKLAESANAKILAEQKQAAEAMQKQGKEALADQSRALQARSVKTLLEQNRQYEENIEFGRKAGQKQFDAVVAGSAEKAGRYSSQAADPFYRVKSLNAAVSESAGHVTVKVAVPDHEAAQVRVTHQPGAITVSTSRRFEGSARIEDGRKLSTHSYQTLTEVLPVNGALDMRNLSKTYEGGSLVFIIPKI